VGGSKVLLLFLINTFVLTLRGGAMMDTTINIGKLATALMISVVAN